MIATPSASALRRRDIALYASGSFGTGVFSTVPTVLLLYFCTEIARIPPDLAALIVLLPKLWSIVWDPLVGHWSDLSGTRWGRRRPFMAVGAAGVAIAFFLTFSPLSSTPEIAALRVGFAYFFLTTFYSLFAVPYSAIPADLAAVGTDRSRLIAARMTVVMVGILAGAGLAPFLVEAGGGGGRGYSAMALVLGVGAGAAMTLPLAMRAPPVARPASRGSSTFKAALAAVARSRRFRLLSLSFVLLLTAIGVVSSATPYLVVRSLELSEASVGAALAAYLVAATLSVPLWARLGKWVGTSRALVAGAVLYAATSITLGLGATSLGWPKAIALFAVAGVPFAALQLLPFDAAARIIHEEAPGSEGALTGLWTATEKIGLALGPTVTALLLTRIGDTAAVAAPRLMAVMPALLVVVALIPLLMIDDQPRCTGV